MHKSDQIKKCQELKKKEGKKSRKQQGNSSCSLLDGLRLLIYSINKSL